MLAFRTDGNSILDAVIVFRELREEEFVYIIVSYNSHLAIMFMSDFSQN